MLSVDDLVNDEIIRKEFLPMALKNVEEGRCEPETLKDATTLVDVTESLIVSDHVREWCKLQYPGHRDGCPKYGMRPVCPPSAPSVSDFIDLGLPHFFLIQPFCLSAHAAKLKKQHPGWTQRQCRNPRYWQKRVVSVLRAAANRITEEHPELCYTVIPEAMGVFVLATARRVGIPMKRIPGRFVFKVALIGYLKSGKVQISLDQFCAPSITSEAIASSLSDTSQMDVILSVLFIRGDMKEKNLRNYVKASCSIRGIPFNILEFYDDLRALDEFIQFSPSPFQLSLDSMISLTEKGKKVARKLKGGTP